MKPISYSEAFGKICSLMATIPFYQVLPLIAIERRVASSLSRNQFIHFEDKHGLAAGYASWMWLTDDEEESYLQDPIGLTKLDKQKLTTRTEENSSNLWIVDFCGRKSAARKIALHLNKRFSKEQPGIESAKTVRWNGRRAFPYLHQFSRAGVANNSEDLSPNPTTRKACLRDVYDLAPRMRWQDREEVRLNSGRNPFEALLNGYSNSKVCYAFEFDGRCIGMYGLADNSKEKDAGMIWLLSSDELQNHPLYKARVGKKFVKEGLQIYAKLMNYIHEETQQDTIEWLKFLEFKFTQEVENHNQRGGKFWKFEKNCESLSP